MSGSQLFNCFGELRSIGDSCNADNEALGEEIEIGTRGVDLRGQHGIRLIDQIGSVGTIVILQ